MRVFSGLLAGAAAIGFALSAQATPWGGDPSGNADGSIPAWSGGGVQTSNGRTIVDAFPVGSPTLTITAANADQYAGNLSAGQMAMLKRYPEYVINVYPTRRVFTNPSGVMGAIAAEAGSISLVGDQGLSGLDQSTVPFPRASNGLQVVWNHIARYRSPAFVRNYSQVPVQSNGAYTAQRFRESIIARRGFANTADNENMLVKFLQEILSPAQLEGNVLLVHEFIDQVKDPRAAWVYNAGQRRVRRAPNVAYDGPGTAANGMRTTDDFDMFSGSPDKYQWRLNGKKEMFVPANSTALAAAGSVGAVLGEKHLNQAFARYEKRRVWHVTATLKGGERHIYGKRELYFDEDGWLIVLADHFDSRGELWRVKEGHNVWESTQQISLFVGEMIYDLQAGRYLALSLAAGQNPQFDFNVNLSDDDFTPSALRRAGRK